MSHTYQLGTWTAFALGLSILVLPESAWAQEERPNDFETATTDDGYSVKFEDDPLAALGHGPRDDWIRIRDSGMRSYLIRPRVSFVRAMLRSAEDL